MWVIYYAALINIFPRYDTAAGESTGGTRKIRRIPRSTCFKPSNDLTACGSVNAGTRCHVCDILAICL